MVLKHKRLWLLSFCSTEAGKTRAFRTWHFTAAASPRFTGHGTPPNLESVCATKLRILAAGCEGRRWSVSRSRLGRGGLTQFCITFCDTCSEQVISDQKKSSRNGSGSHVPGKTSRHRPHTALKLGSGVSQLNGAYALEVWCLPVSCEARTRGSGEVLCAKSAFFLV